MLSSLLGFVFWATVFALLARRRALHDDAEALRQLSVEHRQRVLARYPDLSRWRALQNLVREDIALDDQASVARFHFAPGTRRLMTWRAQKAALGAAGCLTIIIVSQAVNPLLNVIFGVLAALFVGLTLWRLLRLRRMADSLEVSPFNLTEISHRGVRRVLSWQQSLELRNHPRRGCFEIGPPGYPDPIRLDYRLLEFERALSLVLMYGGFRSESPAPNEIGTIIPEPPPAMDDDELEELFDPDARLSQTERANRHATKRQKYQQLLAEHPNHPTIEHVVDDRVLLLGLDQMYRTRMKRHESTELLECGRAVATVLNVPPADVPIESYYWETRRLTEYFRLIRGLQAVDVKHRRRVSEMREFQRLLSVVSAPIYGCSVEDGKLFPVSRDPLWQALEDTARAEGSWTLDKVVERSYRVAVETQDFSLVGLAALVRDAVVLAAVRESVALYAAVGVFSRAEREPPVPVFVWRVDEELARRAARFVATFNELFDDDLPEPVAENGDLYFEAVDEERIIGRCICIGRTPPPKRFYHWAVYRGDDGRPAVEEFWDTRLWTTKGYSRRERT